MKTSRASEIRPLLSGGDRRSIADSNRVRQLVENNASLVIELVALTADEDWLVAQRALDLLEKLAHDHADWIAPHKQIFTAWHSLLCDCIGAASGRSVAQFAW